MENHFDLNELKQFTGSEVIYRHWANNKMVYTEGVQFFAGKVNCYWLIDAVGHIIFPQLLKKHFDHFYVINFLVNFDGTALISIDDGNGNVHLNHEIKWTDFPIIGKPVKFYLCDNGRHYCLMLPSEY